MRKLSSYQFGWVVGWLDAEGSFSRSARGYSWVSVTQADSGYWCLERLQQLCGGVIYPKKAYGPNRQSQHQWVLYGPAGHALMRRLRRFLSPKRQRQIDRSLLPRTKEEKRKGNDYNRPFSRRHHAINRDKINAYKRAKYAAAKAA